MDCEKVILLSEEEVKKLTEISEQAVSYFKPLRRGGNSAYKVFNDTDSTKRLNQTLCGLMAEFAVSKYLTELSIQHLSSIGEQLQRGYQIEDIDKPDFYVQYYSEEWTELEVKTNQLHHHKRYQRMLTPKHWHKYYKQGSMVVWTATDIAERRVYITGWNCVYRDMSPDKMNYVKTLVENFQVDQAIPQRRIEQEAQDWIQVTGRRRTRSESDHFVWRGCFY